METWYTNISEQYKYFTWTPERTGSTHFTNILKKLGFQSANIVRNKIVSYEDEPRHNHFCSLFENHEEYNFLITTRNPYSMVISRTGAPSMIKEFQTPKLIEGRIENMMQNPLDYPLCCQCFHNRKPDYFIRLENIYHDWSNLPFMKNHELTLSGELKRLCSTRMNEQKNTEDKDYWKRFYNQRVADLVYYNFPESFEIFGYDKNSWRV